MPDRGIDTVIDLEGGLDVGVPTEPHEILYIYYPILDEALPEPTRTDAVASLGALLVGQGHRVLSHCGMGFNRSALIAGLILHKLGMPGPQVVAQIRARAPRRAVQRAVRPPPRSAALEIGRPEGRKPRP